MTQVKLDRIEGASARRTAEGWQVERTAYVSGLSGDSDQRMAQAITASGMPALRQAHPSIGGIFVTGLDATPAGPAAAVVRITYGPPNSSQLPEMGQPPQIDVGATLSQVQTSRDASGSPLIVALGSGPEAQSQVAQVSRFVPQTTVRYSRLETGSPGDKARNYVGKVNATTFFASDPGTWMCTGITGRSHDGGTTYEVTYDFQYNPDGWQPVIQYIDPLTGRPHPDASPVTATVYASINFQNLGL